MILPHPESNLKINIMVLGVDIIEELKRKGFVLGEDILENFLKKDPRRTPDMFFNSLTFLYSFGLIERKGYKIRLVKTNNRQKGLF